LINGIKCIYLTLVFSLVIKKVNIPTWSEVLSNYRKRGNSEASNYVHIQEIHTFYRDQFFITDWTWTRTVSILIQINSVQIFTNTLSMYKINIQKHLFFQTNCSGRCMLAHPLWKWQNYVKLINYETAIHFKRWTYRFRYVMVQH